MRDMPGFSRGLPPLWLTDAGARPPEPAQVVDSAVAVWGHDDALKFSQGRQ
jgi:hypothetical protein